MDPAAETHEEGGGQVVLRVNVFSRGRGLRFPRPFPHPSSFQVTGRASKLTRLIKGRFFHGCYSELMIDREHRARSGHLWGDRQKI